MTLILPRSRLPIILAWALICLGLGSATAVLWTGGLLVAASSAKVVESSPESVSLASSAVRVALKSDSAASGPKLLSEYLQTLPPGQRLYLVLRRPRARAQPGVV